ncbi:hypothetical protein ACM01_15125 [Streptomyces viridochromogenes]|uniref:Uncharacterized protein n=1 Tax=Streptomyces viridochromogenes TaxID=1938 RepID=A0A0J7ZEI0_STRVR|nr:hypothetical protein [Streptomyces viridochromogenes]KMS74244.1 hypothetical protein ACM01_15125 [Streptomyces viridochromogenes]
MHTVRNRFSLVLDALRRHGSVIRAQVQDRGASATEWGLILVAGGTMVGVVYAAANTTVGEKAAQILGF